jgi:hypothetical protein
VVNAEMALWTAGFVLFTLTVNAPLLGPLMSALQLNATSAAIKAMHKWVGVCVGCAGVWE